LLETSKILCLFLPLLLSNTDNKKGLLFGLYIACCMASTIGVSAYILHSDRFRLIQSINGITRVQGVLEYANTMAVFCGIGIILSIYYIKKYESCKFANEIMLGVNGVCLIMTGSKLGMAAFAFSVVMVLCLKYKKIIPYALGALATAILYVALLFATGRENIILGSTLACRLIYWHDALKVILKNPFGVGVYGWQELQYKIQTANYSVKYVHNGFLQLALDGGILSFLGALLMVASGIIAAVRQYLKERKEISLHLLAILLLIATHSLVDIDFAYGAIWLSLGLALCFTKTEEIKINKRIVFILCLVFSVNSMFSKADNANRVEALAKEFSIAYINNDFETMHNLSKEWLAEAPRQQCAYDACFISLTALNKKDELNALYKTVSEINKSMNVLCKYLSQHQNIVLPGKD